MGRACSTYGEMRNAYLKGRDHSEELCVYGRIIL